MKSAEEWEAQQLFQEAEEARQLAQAMRLSAVSCEWQMSGQMQAFYQFCEEVGLSPDDVERPTQRPRASDRAQDFRFAKKCHKRGITTGCSGRNGAKVAALRAAQRLAEEAMSRMLGADWRAEVERRLEEPRARYVMERLMAGEGAG